MHPAMLESQSLSMTGAGDMSKTVPETVNLPERQLNHDAAACVKGVLCCAQLRLKL